MSLPRVGAVATRAGPPTSVFRIPQSRAFSASFWRRQTPQHPQQSSPQPSAESSQEPRKYSVKNYRGLELPWLRVFLAAMLTYQLAYWSWEKMRTDEIVEQKTAEVQSLEKELEAAQQKKEETKPTKSWFSF